MIIDSKILFVFLNFQPSGFRICIPIQLAEAVKFRRKARLTVGSSRNIEAVHWLQSQLLEHLDIRSAINS